ncbi:MAG: class I SAM-dependent methyltransferase [Thermomicrobiales bacterium]
MASDRESDHLTDPFDRLVEQADQPFSGWDFSFISATGRMVGAPLPWSYASRALAEMARAQSLLDMDTGGGELLAALRPLPPVAFATEGYAPNIPIARQRLEPLGVHVVKVAEGRLPFDDNRFDLVLNRHGFYDPAELFRVLRPGGRFLTQQVGGKSYRGIPALLDAPAPGEFDHWELASAVRQVADCGLQVLDQQEVYPATRFYDVGALVFYLKAIPWVLPGFTVATHREALRRAHQQMRNKGYLEIEDHRFLIVAEKPGSDRES